MAFFRTVSINETMPAIAGAGVTLRAPQSSDHAEWAALREASRAFLVPWEPTWPADDLTRGAFRRRNAPRVRSSAGQVGSQGTRKARLASRSAAHSAWSLLCGARNVTPAPAIAGMVSLMLTV